MHKNLRMLKACVKIINFLMSIITARMWRLGWQLGGDDAERVPNNLIVAEIFHHEKHKMRVLGSFTM